MLRWIIFAFSIVGAQASAQETLASQTVPDAAHASVKVSDRPLTAPATSLARDAKRLLIGLPEGGIVVCDREGKSGLVVRFPKPEAPTRHVRLLETEAVWRTGNSICRFDFKTKTVAVRDAMTEEANDLFASPAPPIFERTANTIRLTDNYTVSTQYKPDYPGGDGPVAVSGDSIWWTTNDMIFRHDRAAQTTEAYLPWAGAGGVVRDIIAEGRGIWAATPTGTRHFYPMDSAFDGFLRVRLTPTDEIPTGDTKTKMADFITQWQGVPYLWGGTTKAGCDCSGFVGSLFQSVGVTLPRTSGDIAKAGSEVEGDLRWGDLICPPGHVAVYIGKGKTAEALGTPQKGGAVGKATIWRRQNVRVRRVLP